MLAFVKVSLRLQLAKMITITAAARALQLHQAITLVHKEARSAILVIFLMEIDIISPTKQ